MTPHITGPMRRAMLDAGCTVRGTVWSDGNATAVFTQDGDGVLIINELWATVTGQGHGSRMLKTICQCADATGTVLALVIIPYQIGRRGGIIFRNRPDGLGKRQLHAWYVRHGFRPGAENLFQREPVRPS